MSATLVIFDLDGTLVDTAPDLIDALNHTIAADGLAPVTFEDLTHLVGQGARMMIKRAFALRETPLADDAIEPLYDRFITHYMAQMPGQSVPYPGVVPALERLSANGFALAVCTNKASVLTHALLERLDLTRHFGTITCGDTFEWRKPDPRHILGTIDKAGGEVSRAIMIGDSINDILAARHAGVVSIGVPFGYSDVPMAELSPDRLIDTYDDLDATLVDGLLARRIAAA